MRFAILFHRFGPYHIARLNATAKLGDLVGVELSGSGGEYGWDPVSTDSFRRITVCPEGDTNALPPAERIARIETALNEIDPDALAIAGYSDPGMLIAARWGLNRGKKLILMSDSQYHDEPRRWWKEWIKRRLVSCFGSGFVAGTTHAEYLHRLGMPRERIFKGYDVVDNDHFSRGAKVARNDPGARMRMGMPERFFLALARFVPKKNLGGLLEAYADYRRHRGTDAWDLVVIGDGPLRKQLEGQIDHLGIAAHVRLTGFIQYDQLPAYYGMASAFVLPSLQDQWGLVVNEAMAAGLPVIVSDVCGCSPDLVRHGENGYTFPPRDLKRLAEQLGLLSSDADAGEALGRIGNSMITNWSVEQFASNSWAAASSAEAVGSKRKWAFFNILAKRLIGN
jgi:glycosyltransferase involved in cell wall biosynthesis